MNITLTIITSLLILSIATPFISLYAVSLIKKKEYSKHIKIQKRLFWVCVTGVIILEIYIRISGGSGSLVMNSEYSDSSFFNLILIAHIVGAVITYIIWAISLFWSNNIYQKGHTLPGSFSKTHKRLGYITIIGLFYTAITALWVCSLAFFV